MRRETSEWEARLRQALNRVHESAEPPRETVKNEAQFFGRHTSAPTSRELRTQIWRAVFKTDNYARLRPHFLREKAAFNEALLPRSQWAKISYLILGTICAYPCPI
jgi:hypothetical protein